MAFGGAAQREFTVRATFIAFVHLTHFIDVTQPTFLSLFVCRGVRDSKHLTDYIVSKIIFISACVISPFALAGFIKTFVVAFEI